MDNFTIEVLYPFEQPSQDTKLVLFSDTDIRFDRSEVNPYLRACADYAAKYKVHLASGLFTHRRNLCLCLIGPRGNAICRQGGIHLALHLQSELFSDDEVQVAHTDLCNLYLCVDEDIYRPQPVRTAALKGADVVIAVQSIDPAEDTPDRLMRSAWNIAQTNNVYVVNLTSGGCTVTCPVPVTRARDGYLLRQQSQLPLRFALNMERLDEVRAKFPLIESINMDLVDTYADQLRRW